MAPPRLDELAAELIIEVARHLWLGDMSCLARANRRLYQVVDPFLYRTDAQPYNQYALFWAAEHGLLTVAERALEGGTPAAPYNYYPSGLRPFGHTLVAEDEMLDTLKEPMGLTPIDLAAAAGHAEVAALLVGNLPLMWWQYPSIAIDQADANGHIETIDMFLQHAGEMSEHVRGMAQLAFAAAAKAGQRAMLERLLEIRDGPATVDRPVYAHHSSVMMEAAGVGHDEIWDLLSSIQPLAELDALTDVQDEQLYRCLSMQVTGSGSRGITELVEKFTSLGYDWKRVGVVQRMLGGAFARDNIPLMELLLTHSSDEQQDREMVLERNAGEIVCFGVYKMLLADGIHHSVWERLFTEALDFESVEEAQILMSDVPDIPKWNIERGVDMLHVACYTGFVELVELLLSLDSTSGGRGIIQEAELTHLHMTKLLQPLMMPGREDERLRIARLLLETGCDPNKHSAAGFQLGSPLRRACQYGLPRVAQLLIEYGADVLEADARGCSILHSACHYFPDVVLIEELLKRGADAMARTADGSTPLHQLCLSNGKRPAANEITSRCQVAKLLISHGADPNARDMAAATPLHLACSNTPYRMGRQDAKVVLALLEHGADMEKRDSGFNTPLSIACLTLYHSAAAVLLSKGAELPCPRLPYDDFIDGNRWLNRDDGSAHEMAKLLLAHGTNLHTMRQVMPPFIQDLKIFEALRLLMVHRGLQWISRLLLCVDSRRSHSRTEELAKALGMVLRTGKENVVVLMYPREKATSLEQYDLFLDDPRVYSSRAGLYPTPFMPGYI